MKTSPSTLLATLLTSGLVFSCNGWEESEPNDDEELLGEAEQTVHGTWDTTDYFPGVAVLQTASNGACTGTLVSTRYIVTAAHCFKPSDLTADVYVYFDANTMIAGHSVPASRIFKHTGSATNPVMIHPEFPMANPIPWSDSAFSRDVAIFALDTVVPTSIAIRHERVAGVAGNPVCNYDGEAPMSTRAGQNVGFGGFTDSDADQARSYAITWGWEDVTSPECSAVGGPYESACNAYIMNEIEYETTGWSSPGDSGGPLFEGIYNEGSNNLICGNSSYTKWWTFAADENIYSNYSRGSTNAFMNAVLADPQNEGWLRGACDTVIGDPQRDWDGDGINNAAGCDVCPNIADPAQADTDRDGVGDLCDNCPSVPNRDQVNSAAVGQRIADGGAATLDRRAPAPPTNPALVAAWQASFPGNACNVHPMATFADATGKTSDSTNSTRPYHPVKVDHVCTNSTSTSDGEAKPEANNVIVVESFNGGTSDLVADTRMAFCRCSAAVNDADCIASCPRGSSIAVVPAPFGATRWQPMRLQESGTGQFPVALNTGGTYTNWNPGSQTLGDIVTQHPSAAPSGSGAVTAKPSTRQLAWKYWDDFAPSELPAVPTTAPLHGVTTVVSKPLLWSWVRNYGAAGAPRAGTTDPSNAHRRQDLTRFELAESTTRPVDLCDHLKRLVIPERVTYLPGLDDCWRCGMISRVRRPDDLIFPGFQYIAPHGGVRPLADVAGPELLTLLADDSLEVVTATDKGKGLDAIADRAAFYTKDTHDVVAAVYLDEGTLKVRNMNVSGDLMPGAGNGVAFSARRNEVAFFDGVNPLNFDQLAMRRVSLDMEYTFVNALSFTDAPLAGPVVSAAYRELDDAYFILSRGGDKIALHRVDLTMATRLVAEWTDSGEAKNVDITISDEGVVAITRRDASHFGVFVVTVAPDLAVGYEAYLTGEEQLLLPAMITPEGLLLDRSGVAQDDIVSIQQSGASVTFHHASSASFQEMFQ